MIKIKQKDEPRLKRHELKKQIEYAVFKSTLTRYKIIKFRSKLSFIALQRCLTIKEVILFAILKTYQIHISDGENVKPYEYTEESNQLFKEQIGDEIDVRNTGLNAPLENEEDKIQKLKNRNFPVKRAKAKT